MAASTSGLWDKVVATTDAALRTGALIPVATTGAVIQDAGIRFFVRVLSNLRRKDEARKDQGRADGKPLNPFLPPEAGLFVAELTDTHCALLNKFNVVEHHLLIVTRGFEDQETLLTLRDFEALWLCMGAYEGLGFYNGGTEAGASQRHKHLQLVPLPLANESPAVPMEPLFEGRGSAGPTEIPAFPFRHSFVRLPAGLERKPRDAALMTFGLYADMLGQVGMDKPGTSGMNRQSAPYCFLATRRWMLLAPRTREHYEDISLNSLAFAGSFFVRNDAQLERLKEVGPLNALAAVSVPKDPHS